MTATPVDASRGAVLIAAISGRALAQAARRSGYAPLVADLFGDDDTAAAARANVAVMGGVARGFALRPLLFALGRLAEGRQPLGLVYGSGFEDRPGMLAALDARFGLIGNPAAVVARVKDPVAFAGLCRELAIPHPEIATGAVPDLGDWLRKRSGASGGGHVQVAAGDRATGGRWYAQRRMAGTAVSVLFLADGRRTRLLGSSAQWTAPSAGSPYRYGGAARPARLADAIAGAVSVAIENLVAATGLRGLNSADLLVRDDGFDLLEINPRPGATLDVFHDPAGSVFDLHIAACRGELPAEIPCFPGAEAAAVVYADRPVTVPRGFVWPEWTADRQPAGRAVAAGAPLCTVLAEAADAHAARVLVGLRANTIWAMTGDATTGHATTGDATTGAT